MTRCVAGKFVLYHNPEFSSPLWPALICPRGFGPQGFLDTHPGTCVHSILLMGKLVFRWARTADLHDYVPPIPVTDEETAQITPGLAEAYKLTESAIKQHLGLDHWRRVVQKEVTIINRDLDGPEENSSLDSNDELGVAQMPWANRQSGLKCPKLEIPTMLSPALSSQHSSRRSKTVSTISDTDTEDVNKDEGPLQLPTPTSTPRFPSSPLNTVRATPTKRVPFPAKYLEDEQSRTPSSPIESISPRKRPRHAEQGTRKKQSTLSFLPASAKNSQNLKQSTRLPAVPRGDVIKGDIEASKDYVRVRVGPERDLFMIPRNYLWGRAYFRDFKAGLMHFSIDDNDQYELTHPALIDIEPEDFTFVAQYLESGSFGHRFPSEDKAGEAFAQNMSAWVTAEKLGMTDLMDHVVGKMEILAPRDLWNVLAFAGIVYRSPGIALPAQVRMKSLLASDISQHYWEFIEDESFGKEVIQRLKGIPELERDVCVKRAAVLGARLEVTDKTD